MGKVVNSRFLRLGYNVDWLSPYLVNSWEGNKFLKDYWYSNYIRGTIRWLMRKGDYSFQDIGIWYSHSCINRKGKILELCVFFRECDIDGFLYRGYTSIFDPLEGRNFRKRWKVSGIDINSRLNFLKLRYLMYESLRRRVMLDLKSVLGLNIRLKFYKIKRNQLSSMVVGEYIYKRLNDGESIKDVLWDFKRELRKLDEEVKGLEVFSIKRGKRYIWLRKRKKLKLRVKRLSLKKGSRLRYKLCRMKLDKRNRFVRIALGVRMIKLRRKKLWSFRSKRKIFKIWRHSWEIKGLQIEGRGMFVRRHKSMSQVFKLLKGRVAQSSFDENIDYTELSINLRTSKCGLKIWLNRGNRGKLGKNFLMKDAS